jgi:hypothetical protein
VSAQGAIIAAGQLVVGWAMAAPVPWLARRSSRFRGLRAHALILSASIAVGLASVVIGGWLGWMDASALPATCDVVLGQRCCSSPQVPSFCLHPASLPGGQASVAVRGR